MVGIRHIPNDSGLATSESYISAILWSNMFPIGRGKLPAGMNFTIGKNGNEIECGPATEARTTAKGARPFRYLRILMRLSFKPKTGFFSQAEMYILRK